MNKEKVPQKLISLMSALAVTLSAAVMPVYADAKNMTVSFFTNAGDNAYVNGTDDNGKRAYTVSSAVNIREAVINDDGTTAYVTKPGTPMMSNQMYGSYATGIHNTAFEAGFYKFKVRVRADSGVGTAVFTSTNGEKAKTIAAYTDTGSYKGFISKPYLDTQLKDYVFKSTVKDGAGQWQDLESPLIYINENIEKNNGNSRLYIGFINDTETETVDVSSAGTYKSIEPVITGLPNVVALPEMDTKTEELAAVMTVDGINMTAFDAYETEANGVYSRDVGGLTYTLKEAPEGVSVSGGSLIISADTDYHAPVVIGVSYDGREITTHSIRLAPGVDIKPEISGLFVGGTPYAGNTLTAKYTYFDENGDAESGTEYVWYRNDEVIPGANQKSYVLTADDKGKQISVAVTPKNSGEYGIGDTVTSSKTSSVRDGNIIACGDIESDITGIIGTSSNANGDWSVVEVIEDESLSYSGNKSLKITRGPAAIKDPHHYFTAVKITAGITTPSNYKEAYRANIYKVTAKIKGAADDYALVNAYEGHAHYSNVAGKGKYFIKVSSDYSNGGVMPYIFSDVTDAENGWKNVEALIYATEPNRPVDIRIALKEGNEPVYIDDITVAVAEPQITGNSNLIEKSVLNGEEKTFILESETISVDGITFPTVTASDVPTYAELGIGEWSYAQINLPKFAPSSYSYTVKCPYGVTYDEKTKTITVAAGARPGTISIYSNYRGGAYILRTIELVANQFVLNADLQENGLLTVHEENNTDAAVDRIIFAARYNGDSNSMKDLVVLTNDNTSAAGNTNDYAHTFADYNQGELIKVFIWNSLGEMIPVADSISKSINPATIAAE